MIHFRESAFKHGIHQDDIIHAVAQSLRTFDYQEKGESSKIFIIGPDKSGNLLEIICFTARGDELIVAHAMKLRKKYHLLFDRKGSI